MHEYNYDFITDRLAIGNVASRATPGFVAVVSILATDRPGTLACEVTGAPEVPNGVQVQLVAGARIAVVVVDIDSEKACWWAKEHLPATPVVTISGRDTAGWRGQHWYYRRPETAPGERAWDEDAQDNIWQVYRGPQRPCFTRPSLEQVPVHHIDLADGECHSMGRPIARDGHRVPSRGLEDYLDDATAFIAAHIKRGCVLVHCGAGKSRSVAVVVAYLCRYMGMSLSEALAFVAARRSGACPAPCFVEAIKRWLRLDELATKGPRR